MDRIFRRYCGSNPTSAQNGLLLAQLASLQTIDDAEYILSLERNKSGEALNPGLKGTTIIVKRL